MERNRTTLVQIASLLVVGVAALWAGSAARGEPAASAAAAPQHAPVVVRLKPRNGSGVSGTATLSSAGTKVHVVLRLSKPVRGSLPVHLHVGSCKVDPNLNVWESLKNVVKGTSATTLKYTTWATLRGRAYSIHVHEPGYALIACGDLPRPKR
jgi:hypothetical protein